MAFGQRHKVDRARALAGHREKFELWQPRDQRFRKRRAFAHRHQNLEIRQLGGGIILAGEGLAEKHHLGAGAQGGPIGRCFGSILPVIKNRNAHESVPL